MTKTIKQELEIQRDAITHFLETKALDAFPDNLADATSHIMSLKGKRLRPIMVLMSANGFGANNDKAISAAASIEIFHNFTLIHDDIMDNASLRRGKVTVHEKFGINKAIVTGDAMLPHSIGLLIKSNEEKSSELIQCFLKMAKEVMEGQQFDMQFEDQKEVTVEEYMDMIRLKTSVLFGCACEIGAIIGNASKDDKQKLYDFGLYSGLAFQIMDDYLDTFGDESFGKRIGGDILLNKKTFLLTNAIQNADSNQKDRIAKLIDEKDETVKISGFQNLFREMGIAQLALDEMERLHQKSVDAVKSSSLSEEYKHKMIELGEIMLQRTT